MLDWLKSILGEAYTEDIESKISTEIGKGFVAKSDFNALGATKKQLEQDIKTRDEQIAELKKTDPEKLQETITALQKQNADDKAAHEAQLKQSRIDAAVELELMAAKAKNVTAAKALLGEFLTTAEVDDKGNVKGLGDAIKALAEDKGTSFLFDSGKLKLSGAKTGESEDGDQTEAVDSAVSFAKAAAQSAVTSNGESNYFK